MNKVIDNAVDEIVPGELEEKILDKISLIFIMYKVKYVPAASTQRWLQGISTLGVRLVPEGQGYPQRLPNVYFFWSLWT